MTKRSYERARIHARSQPTVRQNSFPTVPVFAPVSGQPAEQLVPGQPAKKSGAAERSYRGTNYDIKILVLLTLMGTTNSIHKGEFHGGSTDGR